MLVKVLKSFPYAEDGHTLVHLEEGDREVREDLIPGLVAEGYIEDPTAPAKPAKVEKAPADAKPADAEKPAS